MPIKLRTIWPALILATNRTERVMGRTKILTVSINTKKGFNQSGAPPGNNPAIKVEGEFINLESNKANHKGNPKIKLKTIWLLYLNLYGRSPHKFTIINIIKSDTTNELKPFKWNEKVREDCIFITSNG